MDENPVPLLGEPAAPDLGARIEARRGDRLFMARLTRLLDENASALQRLVGSDARAVEWRGARRGGGDLRAAPGRRNERAARDEGA